MDEAAARMATTPGRGPRVARPRRARLADRLAARGFSLPAALLALTVEAVTEAPAVAADAAQVPAVAAAAEAAVVAGAGRRLAWVAVACAGVAVGFATAGVILNPDGPPVATPVPRRWNRRPRRRPTGQNCSPQARGRLGNVRFKLATQPTSVRYAPMASDSQSATRAAGFMCSTSAPVESVREFPAAERDDAFPEVVALFSPSGEYLAAVTSGGRVGVWDAEKGESPLWKLPKEDIDVRHLAFSPDGNIWPAVSRARRGAFDCGTR